MYQPYTYTTVSETKVIKKSVAEPSGEAMSAISIYGRYLQNIFSKWSDNKLRINDFINYSHVQR